MISWTKKNDPQIGSEEVKKIKELLSEDLIMKSADNSNTSSFYGVEVINIVWKIIV